MDLCIKNLRISTKKLQTFSSVWYRQWNMAELEEKGPPGLKYFFIFWPTWDIYCLALTSVTSGTYLPECKYLTEAQGGFCRLWF